MKHIILLHGALGAADQLQPLALLLESKGYTVHCPNFSGHGGIPFAARFGIEEFAAELLQYILEQNIQAPDVFAYSMGAYVALYLALKKPGMLGKIITLATKLDWNQDTAAREAGMLIPEKIQSKVPQFAAALKTRHGDQWIELLARTRDMMMQLGDAPLLDASGLSQIQTKVLMGVGDADIMVSIGETIAAQRVIPGAALYVLPQTTHPIEKLPLDLLLPIITRFLKETV